MPITSAFNARSTALEIVAGIDLRGHNALVTGGASGLGLETSRALARAGAMLTLAVRNREQGEAAAAMLRAERESAQVSVRVLDLADLGSVQRLAAAWGATPLHILVNNAAIMACPLTRSAQGWEAQFATNHLGHFLLTTALLPALQAAGQTTAGARVVTLSSSGHKICGVDFDDIHFERRPYNKWQAYGQAKSANALMSLGLHLRHAQDGITSNAVHPGGIMTGLQKFLPLEEMRALGWLKADDTPLDLFKNPEQGASTTVWAATAAALQGQGGRYLEDCAEALPAAPSNRVSGFSPHVMDADGAQRLWALSVRMLAAA
jgi:NAD(P)-dependent dehydrogenase (short-subunit alcohol dehydrogenase family)